MGGLGASTFTGCHYLIDARKGVIEQTYRHFFIANLLRISHVSRRDQDKMDFGDYERIFI